MMRRGTTPTHLFKTKDEFPLSEIEEIYITYSQKGIDLVEKAGRDGVFRGNILRLGDITVYPDNKIIQTELSQEDTLKFRSSSDVDIQIRIKTKDEKALNSNKISSPVEKVLKDGII